ncbi:sulfur carrier protein ThiS [Megasphaera sp.]|uniref:sulfur carrier protein ThiS n=1 Tax=Megasphaera sp. TaxID=2023260 RepID=UPI00351FC2D6
MVRINGKDIEADGQNLLAYLTDQEYRTDRIAIELNGAIVSRKDYDKVTLKDGDSMEIVHFVGGG